MPANIHPLYEISNFVKRNEIAKQNEIAKNERKFCTFLQSHEIVLYCCFNYASTELIFPSTTTNNPLKMGAFPYDSSSHILL